jgi:hypothetical protein
MPKITDRMLLRIRVCFVILYLWIQIVWCFLDFQCLFDIISHSPLKSKQMAQNGRKAKVERKYYDKTGAGKDRHGAQKTG